MYSIKIIEEAYAAVIDLVDGCTSTDKKTLSNMLHLVKLVRSAIRNFPQAAEQLEKKKAVLEVYAAKLKKLTGINFIQYTIEETVVGRNKKKHRLHSHLTNAHCALTYFIRQKLENKETDDFLRLYKIAYLYMQHLFKYSDEIDANPDVKNLDVINAILYVFISDMGHHAGYLENAMRAEGIEFDEIRI
ncbi:MAG: hypothetical protein K2N60_13205 [Oscillospiraceae bacterium]|nr:hypothetical protein [Oscillospiraceae bacterium]